MASAEKSLDEHPVTPLELFFDLVFVFAITQVTSLLAHHPTWLGILHGMLVLAAVWWAWGTYAWLTSALDVDEGGVRLAMVAATALMLGVGLAVPRAFGADAVLLGIAYLLVRLVHFLLSAAVGRNEPDRLGVLVRFAPTAFAGALLILAAGFVPGNWRLAAWIAALAIDYAGPTVVGMGEGWRVAPEHFAERYGLVILIALGESMIAIGVGAGFRLHTIELLAAALGFLLVSALWWLYFDVAAIFARRRLSELQGLDRANLARDAYTYLHLPMVAGIVLFALGLKTTLRHVGDELDPVPAVALCGGPALYLLAHVGFLYRSIHRIFRRRTLAAILLLALIPVATAIPSLVALALVSGICALVVGYEAIGRREYRVRVRHPAPEAAAEDQGGQGSPND
jgi:low temperature requirement protein LtrA